MRILIIILALALCSSCRTVNKNRSTSKEKVNTVTDVSTTVTQTTASSSSVVATRTIVEEIDSNQVQKGSVTTATGTAETLDTGGMIRSETDDQVIEVKKDPKTGRITATGTVKDRKIPVKGKKTTIENVAAVTISTTGTRADQDLHQETDKKSSGTDLQVDREPGVNFILIGFFICLFIAAAFFILWYCKWRDKYRPNQ